MITGILGLNALTRHAANRILEPCNGDTSSIDEWVMSFGLLPGPGVDGRDRGLVMGTEEVAVDPITLIVAALVAGLGAGTTDAAGSAVKDAYQGLRDLLSRRFAGNRPAEIALEQAEEDPGTWEQPLRKYVAATGADHDGAVVKAAQRLMNLVDNTGSQAGKYLIDARYAQGAQFGDHNVQTVIFGGGPGEP